MTDLCLCFASLLGLQQNIIIALHAPPATRSLTQISAFLVHSASFFTALLCQIEVMYVPETRRKLEFDLYFDGFCFPLI